MKEKRVLKHALCPPHDIDDVLMMSTTYVKDLLLWRICVFLCRAGRLEFLDLRIDIVDLSAHILDDLTFELFCFLGLGIAAHQAEKLRVVVESHIYISATKLPFIEQNQKLERSRPQKR